MIIECVKCFKKFKVNSDLIPDEGRTIQCGSCNHVWFYKKNYTDNVSIQSKKPSNDEILDFDIDIEDEKSNIQKIAIKNKKNFKQNISKGKSIIKVDKSKSSFSLGTFLSYILVFIVSFIAIMIILDTFKSPLYEIVPELELILFSFYEILKDIKLFLTDLF
tara:strand:- start:324 stop:809 length:486 start_codon:yes stop_codon:yes gene_type:complete